MEKINAYLKLYIFGLILLFVSHNIYGQNLDQKNDSLVFEQDIFSSNNTLFCSLTFNIKEFRKDKMEGNKIPAILTYHKSDSISVHRDIYLMARGQSRKTICYFPPIKLKLKHVSFEDPYMDQVKNQKLVTHCGTTKSSNQTLLKEYLVYKLYNVLTEQSFKVRLMEMNYIDSEQKVKTINRNAFLIEDSKVLANRNNSMLIKAETLGMGHVEKSSMIMLSLFQYMIGNVDWSIAGLHNTKLIKSKDFGHELPFAVPYDFDYSGFVNASYAVNVLDPKIESVKIRMFVGVCFTEEEYLTGIQKFIDHKNEIYAVINDFELLEYKHRKNIISYIDEFYKTLEQPNFYEKYVLSNCKNYNN